MTYAQRRVHLLLWLVLTPVALAGLVLAVAWRPAQPVQDGPLPGVSTRDAAATEPGGSP
ncbi:MAG: hypothetical protein ACE37H_00955 [Phycisphaeraceae bacterium]